MEVVLPISRIARVQGVNASRVVPIFIFVTTRDILPAAAAFSIGIYTAPAQADSALAHTQGKGQHQNRLPAAGTSQRQCDDRYIPIVFSRGTVHSITAGGTQGILFPNLVRDLFSAGQLFGRLIPALVDLRGESPQVFQLQAQIDFLPALPGFGVHYHIQNAGLIVAAVLHIRVSAELSFVYLDLRAGRAGTVRGGVQQIVPYFAPGPHLNNVALIRTVQRVRCPDDQLHRIGAGTTRSVIVGQI